MDVRLDDFPPLPNYNEYSILGIIQEANDEESCTVLCIPSKVVRYNLNDITFSKICDFNPAREDMETHLDGKLI